MAEIYIGDNRYGSKFILCSDDLSEHFPRHLGFFSESADDNTGDPPENRL